MLPYQSVVGCGMDPAMKLSYLRDECSSAVTSFASMLVHQPCALWLLGPLRVWKPYAHPQLQSARSPRAKDYIRY
eukprot:622055-Amphidinium_carterae.1